MNSAKMSVPCTQWPYTSECQKHSLLSPQCDPFANDFDLIFHCCESGRVCVCFVQNSIGTFKIAESMAHIELSSTVHVLCPCAHMPNGQIDMTCEFDNWTGQQNKVLCNFYALSVMFELLEHMPFWLENLFALTDWMLQQCVCGIHCGLGIWVNGDWRQHTNKCTRIKFLRSGTGVIKIYQLNCSMHVMYAMLDGPRITYHHFKCYASLWSVYKSIVIAHTLPHLSHPHSFQPLPFGLAFRTILFSILYSTRTEWLLLRYIRIHKEAQSWQTTKQSVVDDGGDDSTYSHVFTIRCSTLLCASFNDIELWRMRKPKRYKAAKISFAQHTHTHTHTKLPQYKWKWLSILRQCV